VNHHSHHSGNYGLYWRWADWVGGTDRTWNEYCERVKKLDRDVARAAAATSQLIFKNTAASAYSDVPVDLLAFANDNNHKSDDTISNADHKSANGIVHEDDSGKMSSDSKSTSSVASPHSNNVGIVHRRTAVGDADSK